MAALLIFPIVESFKIFLLKLQESVFFNGFSDSADKIIKIMEVVLCGQHSTKHFITFNKMMHITHAVISTCSTGASLDNRTLVESMDCLFEGQ